MKSPVLLAVAALLITGCAGSPASNLINNQRNETLHDIMASWVDASEKDLISSWGPPNNSYTLSDGSKVISYESIWGVYVGDRFHCVQKFMLEQGVVTKWGASNCRMYPSNVGQVSKDIPIPQPTL